MKNLALISVYVIFIILCGKSTNAKKISENQTIVQELTATKVWKIKFQAFESHDATSTDIDTIQGNYRNYFILSDKGKVFTYFDNKYDTMNYKVIGTDSISFGDTPFLITRTKNGLILYQNEQEKNGDYNRIKIYLSKQELIVTKR